MLTRDTAKRNKFYHCLEYDHDQKGDLCLVASGMERVDPGVTYGPDRRDCWHLHVIQSGKGQLTILEDGKMLTLHPQAGQMFILKDGETVKYTSDTADPWNYCWVTYTGTKSKEITEMIGFSDGIYCLDSTVEARQFFELVKHMHEYPEFNYVSDLHRCGILREFLALAIEGTQSAERRMEMRYDYSPEFYVQRAEDFIHYNYATITIGDVVDYIGFSRSYFSTMFKRYKGVSLQTYLRDYRLQQGCRLLIETGLPVNEIAVRIGYIDPLTFSKVFRDKYGASPTDYRKRNNKY
ncbi:MAG: AraC family transcriptional regulator [Mogibacterium sp.]|nr:AraC family transcriptional regulator [Mogibacterium sp.]